jgi:phosphoglycerate dehydrogenase-like enzyme
VVAGRPTGVVRAWLAHPDALALVGELPETVVIEDWDGQEVPPESMRDVEFYVVPFSHFRPALELIPRLPKLRVVHTCTAGFDRVFGLVPPGVTLCNARGVHDTSAAEWVVTAMLAMIREFPEFVVEQHEGRLRQRHTDAVAGQTVLLFGYGSIAKAVERRLAGFDVEIIKVASRARDDDVYGPESLGELLPRSQVVVLLAPLNDSTRGIVDASFLARMPDGALLVNAARGPLVDHGALLEELRSGRLRAAADVGDPEPLPPDHPLLATPGFFYTPHQAGHTRLAVPSAYRLIGEQLRRYVAGEPLVNVVKR